MGIRRKEGGYMGHDYKDIQAKVNITWIRVAKQEHGSTKMVPQCPEGGNHVYLHDKEWNNMLKGKYKDYQWFHVWLYYVSQFANC